MSISRRLLSVLLVAWSGMLPAQAAVEVLWQYSSSGASTGVFFPYEGDFDIQTSEGPFGGFPANHYASYANPAFSAYATLSGQVLANRSSSHVRLAGDLAAEAEVSMKASTGADIDSWASVYIEMHLLISDEPMQLTVSNSSIVVRSGLGLFTVKRAYFELRLGSIGGPLTTIDLGSGSGTNQFVANLNPGTHDIRIAMLVDINEFGSDPGDVARISQASQWSLLVAPANFPEPSSAPEITTGSPPEGTLGEPYSFLMAATGDPLPSFQVTTGALPPGLSLSAEGLLAGTPTNAGKFSFAVQAWNGATNTDTKDYEILIRRAPVVFLHGVAGSVLKDGNEYIWPTVDPANVAKLHLVEGATNAVAVDAVREYDLGGLGVKILPFYGQFLRQATQAYGYVEFDLAEDRSRLTNFYLLNQSFPEPPNLFVYPYDWRKPNAEHTAALHTFIQRIRAVNGDRKVNLVAHSMGGLVMRRYLLDYGTDDIGRIVTVGSPIWGAPESAFRMFTGIFFNEFPIDLINSTPMKKSVLSMPAVHELNPSSKYLQHWGFPVFTEIGSDYNENGIPNEGYSSEQFRAALDAEAYPQTPATNNIAFHGHLGGRQDDWSQDSGVNPFLHIIGKQAIDETTVGIKVRTVPFLLNPAAGLQTMQVFWRVKGEGDGTVPTLSSQRLPEYYAPGTIVREITEPLANVPSAKQPAGQAAEHTMLMFNTNVWNMIHAFLDNRTVPTLSPLQQGAGAAMAMRFSPSVTPRRSVLVMGCSPVHIRSGDGQSNTLYSAAAAQRIPGVEVIYDSEQGWVLIEFDANLDLAVESALDCARVEVEVIDLATDGSPTALRRYRIDAGTHRWRLDLESGSPASMAVDTNDNGGFDPAEAVSPTHTADGAGTDIEPPKVSLSIAHQGNSIRVEATASDVDSSPAILRYSLDGGPLQLYTGPLAFTPSSPAALAIYAEDALGNASGLIRTRLNPELIAARATRSSLTIEWPIADGYRLESAPTITGPWAPVTASTLRRDAYREVLVPLDAESAIYRLAFHPVVLAPMPNRPPTLSLVQPASGTTFVPGSEILAQAGVSDPDGDAVNLTWFIRNAASNIVATSTSNPASFILSTAGDYTLQATATDANGASSVTPSIPIHVRQPFAGEPGAIAFVGFNGDGDDHLAFVALSALPAGTVIFFSDNEWNGQPVGLGGAFNDFAESVLAWQSPAQGVAAGTVILINGIEAAPPLTTSTGTITYASSNNVGVGTSGEAVFAYTGSALAPQTFLAAIGSGSATVFGSLAGTGLTLGTTALVMGNPATPDIMAYVGPRTGQASFAAYRPLLNNLANWISEDGSGNQHTNNIPPDVPFDTTSFTISP